MSTNFDLLIRNGTIYDGSGSPSFIGDVAVNGQHVVSVGNLGNVSAEKVIDAGGLAVAPGFINVMSWAPISLLVDGRSQSDIRQGVTLEVFGEAWSEGPLNEEMKKRVVAEQTDIKYNVTWTTLGQFLEQLEAHGVSTNIASYVGATTLRIHAIGYDDRPPSPQELDLMRKLTAQAMEEGALGVSTALIYPPGSYARTDEIIELAKVAARYNGIYISHMRSEGNALLEAVDELIHIARTANCWAEIYHLKTMGKPNWTKLDGLIQKVETARAAGLHITADMYTYPAGAAGLGATMPPWVQEGGQEAWVNRLKDPSVRQRVKAEMLAPTNQWENMFLMCGSPENMLLIGFNTEALKPLTGKTLADICKTRGTDPVDTIIDLTIEDKGNIGTVYFSMSEDNIRRELKLPWVCLGSDAESAAPEGDFLKSSTHPRAYGCFSRFLGKYVRDEKVVPLAEAVRKITSLPASNLKIEKRGSLKPGFFADIAVFDPGKIQDHATFQNPFQYSTGMVHVFVNGKQVIQDGEHTNARPGMFVRGPGYKNQ